MTRVVRARLMSAKPPFAPDYPDMTSTEYPARQESVAQAIEDLKKSDWCRDAGQDLMSSLEIVLAEQGAPELHRAGRRLHLGFDACARRRPLGCNDFRTASRPARAAKDRHGYPAGKICPK